MVRSVSWMIVWMLVGLLAFGCGGSEDETAVDGDQDAANEEPQVDGDDDTVVPDGDEELEPEEELDAELESEDEIEAEEDLPPAFETTREDVGEPMTAAEITAFTKKITGFWKDSGYFNWVWWMSHGLDASYNPDMPDYKLWWQDTQASKSGDTITFSHTGGADNLTLRTCKVLNNVIAGYLYTGDEMFRRIVIQYLKGLVALSLAYDWSEDEPVKYLQTRALFTINHSYEMEGGRKVAVDYDPVKDHTVYSWNALTIPNPSNPWWGPIWVRTMRSKDDVPHMFRSVPMVKYLAENAEDAEVKAAAEWAYEYLVGFAKDIVDQGYYIRTKGEDGQAYIPKACYDQDDPESYDPYCENQVVNDLASFNNFELLDPLAECKSKLSSALIAYGEPRDNDCGTAGRNLYEELAGAEGAIGNYFNNAIIRYFHFAVLELAYVHGYHGMARNMMVGLIERVEYWMEQVKLPHDSKPEWYADVASHLVAAATAGMPLTSEEARYVAKWYGDSADWYSQWSYWDPWDASVADGAFNYKPSRDDYSTTPKTIYVRPTEVAYMLEYCWSPYKNANGSEFVDCDIVSDPSRWGE